VIFIDTSFWIALHYARDQHQPVAVELWRRHRRDLVTTNLVVGETWTFLRRRLGHQVAVRFVDLLAVSSALTVVRVSDEVEREAWAWPRRHDERVYSFVDATSFATMRRLGLTEALAFDGDFSAAGFVEVRP
jgi:predicted nucleic acid-binding protein